MKHQLILVLFSSIVFSLPSFGEGIVLKGGVGVVSADPLTNGLSGPDKIIAQKLLSAEKRTVSQCNEELKMKQEIYLAAVMSSATHEDLTESLDSDTQAHLNTVLESFNTSSIPPASQGVLGGITYKLAENSWKAHYELCKAQHYSTFTQSFKEVLNSAIIGMTYVKPDAIVAHQKSGHLSLGVHDYDTEDILQDPKATNNKKTSARIAAPHKAGK